jgi:hypothetical protein
MNSDLVIFIDGYLADKSRANACSALIDQLKQNLPYKIALLNKYPFSWGLDHKVDYYFHHGEGFMVGKPPQEFIDNKWYERPYVYVETSLGTLENWLPLTGVSDHVANMYNSFILTSEVARNLGFKRVFKVEADTLFDVSELQDIAKDLETFQDYLLYGERQEGRWTRATNGLADNHISGYSVDLFNGFELVRNDSEFWELGSKIGYYGKWVEYIIPAVINYQKPFTPLEGTHYPGSVRDKYPKTKFDLINSPGEWTQKWENIPKICHLVDSDSNPIPGRIGLVYWNHDSTPLDINSQISNYNNKEVVYSKTLTLNSQCWFYDEIEINYELEVINVNTQNGITKTSTTRITPETIIDLTNRFVKK